MGMATRPVPQAISSTGPPVYRAIAA
jgi:hypothetical protein